MRGLVEEAEAIGWYEQRISLEKDGEVRAIMKNAQKEEFKDFGMDLEFLLRRKKEWRVILRGILFTGPRRGRRRRQTDRDPIPSAPRIVSS